MCLWIDWHETKRFGFERNHPDIADRLEQYEGLVSSLLFSSSFTLSTADFQANYGMCFGWFIQDYDQYKQALQAVHQDEDQARLLQSANEGRVEEVEELLSSREVREWNDVVSRAFECVCLSVSVSRCGRERGSRVCGRDMAMC